MKHSIDVATYELSIRGDVPPSTAALITLWSSDSRKRVLLRFYEVDQKLPENRVEPQPDGFVLIYINLPITRYGWCVDLLRNERPVQASFDDVSKEFFVGTKSREPVGESNEELVPA